MSEVRELLEEAKDALSSLEGRLGEVDASTGFRAHHEFGDHYYQATEHWDDENASFRSRIDGASELSMEGTLIKLERLGDPSSSLSADLAPLLRALVAMEEAGESYGPEEARLEVENEAFRLRVYLETVSGKVEGDTIGLSQLTASFLVQTKQGAL